MGVWLNLTKSQSTTDSTNYTTGSCTPPTSGEIVVIGLNCEDQQNLPTITGTNGWNGLSWTSRSTQVQSSDRVRIMTATSAGGAAGTLTFTYGATAKGLAWSVDTHPDITTEVPVQTGTTSGVGGTSAPITLSAFADASNEGYYIAAIAANATVTIGGGYSGNHSWAVSAFSGVTGWATNDPTPTATFASNNYMAAAVEFAVGSGITDLAEQPGTDDVQNRQTWTADGAQADIHRSQETGFVPGPSTLLDTIGASDTEYIDLTAGDDVEWKYLITDGIQSTGLSNENAIRQAPPRPTDLTLVSKTVDSVRISLTRPASSTRDNHIWYYRVKGDDKWIAHATEDSGGLEGGAWTYTGLAPGVTYEFTATSTSTTYEVESGFAVLLEVATESNVIQTGSLVITGYAPNVIATNQTTQLRVSGFHI